MRLLILVFLLTIISCSEKRETKHKTNLVGGSSVWQASSPKEKLGYHLYFEKKFSADDTISCNTCHNVVNRANGAQNTAVSAGINGQKGGRNSPTVWNAKFLSVQFWDGRAKDLAEQAKGPITNPIEMGMKNHQAALDKIKGNEEYIRMFKKAFPEDDQPINIDNTADAIAAFEMTLVSLDSPFDKQEMSDLAKKGYQQFKELGCVSCHSGEHFAGPELPLGTGFYMKFPTFPNANLEKKYGFSKDLGRYEATQNEADKHMWRVPTLRNVAETAPYFHNGSVADLKTAIKVMGSTQLNLDLTEEQVTSIYAFLESLTGTKQIIEEPASL